MPSVIMTASNVWHVVDDPNGRDREINFKIKNFTMLTKFINYFINLIPTVLILIITNTLNEMIVLGDLRQAETSANRIL